MIDEPFEREEEVRAWMTELAAIPLNGRPLPDARQLWWKAELLKRWDAQRQAVAPIERAEPVHVGIGVAGAFVLLVWLWQNAPLPTTALTVATGLSLMVLVAIAALTLRQS
jgi:hypothetical protein